MTLLALLETSTPLFLALTALFGLMVGSFLNVVIYRLPLMMQRDWRAQCLEYLQLETDDTGAADATPQPVFNLLKPDSHCPACQHKVRPWQNIPIISYLLLKGRCASCQTPISWRYPAVELLTAALSVLVAWRFGPTPACLAALVLTWSLISLTVIDLDHQLLPDSITLPLMWLGLLLSLTPWGLDVTPSAALVGAAAGYLSLWSLYWAFKLLTGREGMGYGDFKLLAALGAWFGWQQLLPIIIISSLTGAVAGVALMVLAGRDRHVPISFGPYLAVAGMIALLWGDRLQAWYLGSLGGISG